MNRALINFKSNRLFPFQFQLSGIVFFIFGLLLILYSLYLTPLFLITGAFILTGYKGIEFDHSNKVYKAYNSFFFIKFSSWKNYNSADRLFVNPANVSQKIYTMVTDGTTARNVVYNAYLKFDNGSSVHLLTSKNKNLILKKLSRLSDFFELEINDNTI